MRRHQLSDVGWQPSKLELQAQLGASRERQSELEWRLQQMEGLLHQHSALLHKGQQAAPLGSLLDAMEAGERVSPPRQVTQGPCALTRCRCCLLFGFCFVWRALMSASVCFLLLLAARRQEGAGGADR